MQACMCDYWLPTALLFHRKPETLDEDERASLVFYAAFIDDMDGLVPNSAPRLWCAAAREVDAFARERDRLPAQGDSERLSAWIQIQRSRPLNSFQRARLGAIPGMDLI